MRPVVRACLFVAICVPAGVASAAPPVGWDYDVSVSPDGEELTVQLCVRGVVPSRLQLMRPDALKAVRMHKHPDGSESFRPGARGAIVPRFGRERCVRYSVSLNALSNAVRGYEIQSADDVRIINPGLFLLHPPAWPAQALVTARFVSLGAAGVLTPWRPTGNDRLVLDPGFMRRGSRVVIGAFRHIAVDAVRARFEVAVLPGPRLATDTGIQAWIRRAAITVSDLFDGRFPVDRVLVIVIPSRASRDPVVFGRTERSGGNTVTLYLAGNARDPALPDEWVAVHEFTHLGLPWFPERDVWISEGFVTYYQEVLRGRSGHLTEREAWQRMHDGFERGRRSGTGRPLEEESRLMHQTHAYRRVYWGGAALALAVDLAIRRHTQGAKSLDDVMRYWWRQFPFGRTHDPRDLLRAADRMLGANACTGLMRRFLAQSRFPTLQAEYAALGLATHDGKIVYREGGSQIAERTRIMRKGGR